MNFCRVAIPLLALFLSGAADVSPGNYGYGWFIQTAPRLKEFHEGSDPGFAAFEARYPQDQAFVIVLSNLEDAPVRAMANDLGALLLDGKIPVEKN